MVQENILPALNGQQTSENKKEKMVVDEVQLCCTVILTFYRNHGKNWLTVEDIFGFLNQHYVTSKEKVQKILETLSDEYLVTKLESKKDGFLLKVEYGWTIRSNKDGLFHLANLND